MLIGYWKIKFVYREIRDNYKYTYTEEGGGYLYIEKIQYIYI